MAYYHFTTFYYTFLLCYKNIVIITPRKILSLPFLYSSLASTPLPLHLFLAAFFPKGAFFKLFFTLELVQQLCNFTNEYMEATKHLRLSLAKNRNKLTPDEFHIFIGLLIYFSIVKLLRLELYWSTEELFHGLWARSFMSKRRYKQIQSFLRASNHKTEKKKTNLPKSYFCTSISDVNV